MQNSTLLLHYSQSILSKMRVHGFLGKNQNYAYLFCGNVDMLDSSKMEGKKNFFFFFEGKKNVFFCFFFFRNSILSEVGSVRIPPDIKIYTIGQNIAENGNNTILNDNIPLPNA